MRSLLSSIALGAFVLSTGCSEPSPPPPPQNDDQGTDVTAQQATAEPTKTAEASDADDGHQDDAGEAVDYSPRRSLAPLIAKLQPSVVNIYTTKLRTTYNPLAPLFSLPPRGVTKERSLGSGFVYNASEGLVVTNYHVVAHANEVKVRLSDRRELEATMLGGDPEIDLALLRVQTTKGLQQIQIGDSDHLEVGDWVLAIGNPFGLSQTVTVGIVSALSRTIGAGPYDDFIQTDASINPGNSGGPLFDMQGRVVGINTAIHRQGQGIGFAIPMSMAQPLIDQIRSNGRVVRVYLGIDIQNVSAELARAMSLPRPAGALVVRVQPASPAAAAGLQPGDVIVEFNDHPIEVSRNLPTQVARTQPGETVEIEIIRNGQPTTLQATMIARPTQPQPTTRPPSIHPQPRGPRSPWPNYPAPQPSPRSPYGP